MKRIGTAERRVRLAVRHHLAPACRAPDVVMAASDMVGLHATDPASVYLEAFARVRDVTFESIESALYEERSLLKFLAMRRTMFVVPIELAAIMRAACSRQIAARERRRVLEMLESAGSDRNPEDWLAKVEAETIAALEELGEATAPQLTKRVPGLREQFLFGQGKKWQGMVGLSTRMLFLLAAEGRIVRGRPNGSWVSSLYRWAPLDRWVPGGLPDLSAAGAQIELARRWLVAFGPGTTADLAWWTGWTIGETRKALAGLDVEEVALEEGAGWVLRDDLDDPASSAAHLGEIAAWVALLPPLDATIMGWTNRTWFLGPHGPLLFDRNGNAGPTVWSDGRVVGGWAQRPSGEIVYRMLEDVGSEASAAIEAEAERLRGWLGDRRFIPRFRTPLEQELSR